jgi:DNA-binding transcriptional LysR family regulator
MHIEWDDLLYVLTVGRTGSLSGAARALRVNHSTVFRRIGHIEQRLGVRLFERRRDGYVPTAAGETALRIVEQIDENVVALERQVAGQDLRPSGTVRLATTDTLVPVVVPLCAEFRRLYPEIAVELVTGNQHLNLSRRDADVALRPSLAPPEDLHGRKIARIAFAAYASKEYTKASGTDLERAHQWIGFDDTLSHLAAYRWLSNKVPAERVCFRANSFLSIIEAVRSSMGVALLPCYLASGADGFIKMSDCVPELATDLWLLVHDDLRRTARVRAFLDFVADRVAEHRTEFEGVVPAR